MGVGWAVVAWLMSQNPNNASSRRRITFISFQVLHTSHQREWEIRVNLLSSHAVFQGWTTRELKLVNGHSKMKTYPPNSVSDMTVNSFKKMLPFSIVYENS